MVKKILKSLMEKQKSSLKPQSTRTLRSHKIINKPAQNDQLNDLKDLATKISVLHLQDESETKDQPVKIKKCQKKNISKNKSTKKSQQKKKEIKKQDFPISPEYKKFISFQCQLHSSNSLNKKTQIKIETNKLVNQQWFNRILSIWNVGKDKKSQKTVNKNECDIIKKAERITYFQSITSTMLKRLKPKHWLNDQVINSYIQLMQLDIIKPNQQQVKDTKMIPFTIHLIQSYFATLKATQQKIQRQIKKRCFTKESTIIIPINESYHWFFVVISNQQFFICDSILPKNLSKKQNLQTLKNVYSNKPTIRKCFQLYQVLYQIQQISLNDIHVIKDFPQQDNQNDCGMMMLCGIKNVLTHFLSLNKKKDGLIKFSLQKQFWNFCQDDIRFLRFLFTRQLIEEKIFFY